MQNFTNKADAIIDLQKRGYDQDFILANENILCIQRGDHIAPDAFEITETYKFEGRASLRDNFVIYAIRSVHDDVKGILMTSYGALSQGMSVHLWAKLAANL